MHSSDHTCLRLHLNAPNHASLSPHWLQTNPRPRNTLKTSDHTSLRPHLPQTMCPSGYAYPKPHPDHAFLRPCLPQATARPCIIQATPAPDLTQTTHSSDHACPTFYSDNACVSMPQTIHLTDHIQTDNAFPQTMPRLPHVPQTTHPTDTTHMSLRPQLSQIIRPSSHAYHRPHPGHMLLRPYIPQTTPAPEHASTTQTSYCN